MQTDTKTPRRSRDLSGMLLPIQGSCSRDTGILKGFPRWCKPLACQPGSPDACRRRNRARQGCPTDTHPNLTDALTVALLVLAGPGQGDEVHLERVGQWPGFPQGTSFAVTVAGQYAYVADGEAGLRVIDLSDPTNPRRAGRYEGPGSAYDVAVSGHYAYVADADEGLLVIDVSDPANPRRVGGGDTPGSATEVAVSGQYAFVADGEWGVQIFRIRALRFDGPLRLTPEGFEAWLDAPATGTYRVEVSGDLRSWQTLTTLTNLSGRVRILDPTASSAAPRFYRAVQVP